jgi:hypothetical protein
MVKRPSAMVRFTKCNINHWKERNEEGSGT